MTKEEYQKLVKSAVSFSELDEDIKIKVLNAEGEEREGYILAFQEEAELMHQAVSDFYDANEKVLIEFKANVQADKADKIKTEESKTKAQDEEQLKNLLGSI